MKTTTPRLLSAKDRTTTIADLYTTLIPKRFPAWKLTHNETTTYHQVFEHNKTPPLTITINHTTDRITATIGARLAEHPHTVPYYSFTLPPPNSPHQFNLTQLNHVFNSYNGKNLIIGINDLFKHPTTDGAIISRIIDSINKQHKNIVIRLIDLGGPSYNIELQKIGYSHCFGVITYANAIMSTYYYDDSQNGKAMKIATINLSHPAIDPVTDIDKIIAQINPK